MAADLPAEQVGAPAQTGTGPARGPRSASRIAATEDHLADGPSRPSGVLLVDDHPENLAALEAVLEPVGEPIIRAGSGEEALRILLRREVAVILLDVRMAGLDGLETARLIRARPATRHIPIVFLTAQLSDAGQIEQAYATGAIDYVVKPLDPSILRAKVAAFVALSRERAERVRQSRARARAEAAARAVRTLQALSDAALAHLELDRLAEELLERACALFSVDAGALLIDAAGEDGLAPIATRGARLRGAGSATFAREGALHDQMTSGIGAIATAGDRMWRELTAAGAGPIGELVAVPFGAAAEAQGLLLLATDEEGAFDETDVELLALAAERIATAIAHAQRFEHERELVEALQRSLLPESLPRHPRFELAAGYHPGGTDAEIGGDWYDAVATDDGRLAVMIGDVVGHGVRAAARMGELRHALRAYIVEGHGPAAALTRLDRLVVASSGVDMVATLVVLMLDPETRSITVARAGHPPPLVRGADGTVRVLDSGHTLPLGVLAGSAPSEYTFALADGDTVLLYTDGLVERRAESIDAGIARLMQALGEAPAAAELACHHVIETLLADLRARDDVAVLALHVRSPVAEPFELGLPARAESVAVARHRLRDWLARAAPDLDADGDAELELILSEACTNVVRHAYADADGRMQITASLDGETVVLAVVDRGHWRAEGDSEGGRGLLLVRALCRSVTIERTPTGTRVEMRWEPSSATR